MRIKNLYIFFCILASIIIINLFYRQLIQFSYWFGLSKRNIIRIVPEEGARGGIFDRNNKIIANSNVRFNVAVIPQEIQDTDKLLRDIAGILGIKTEVLEKRFNRLYLNPFSPVVVATSMDKEKAIILEQEREHLPGMIIQTDFYRLYPYKEATAHILGYVSSISEERYSKLKNYGYRQESKVGYSGIEEYKDSYLQSQSGGASFEVDSKSRAVRLLGIKPAIAGNDLRLTIDIELQKVIQDTISQYKGAVIIMDYTTGEIISLVSSPSFDPNIFITGEDTKKINDILRDKDKPMFNRAISSESSPGSCFKVVLAIAGLQSKRLKLNDSEFCEGVMLAGKQEFSCWSRHGWQNIIEALKNSCNIFFYNLGLKLGVPFIADYAEDLGLGRKTDIDLPNEKQGFIPGISHFFLRGRHKWYKGDTMNFSIGQGEILVTPLQLTRLIAVIANGGKLVRPHIVYKDRDSYEQPINLSPRGVFLEGLTLSEPEGRVEGSLVKRSFDFAPTKVGAPLRISGSEMVRQTHHPERSRRTPRPLNLKLDRTTLDILRRGLRKAVADESGTAHILSMKELKISGKTGTTQVEGSLSNGWFIGYIEKPSWAVCIFLENVGSSFIACKVLRGILERVIRENIQTKS